MSLGLKVHSVSHQRLGRFPFRQLHEKISLIFQKNIWVENCMETRYAVIKVEVQVILLRSRGILDLFIVLLFQREMCIFLCI